MRKKIMRNNTAITSVKELNDVRKNAKAQANALVFSPFFIMNTLNGIYSGNVTKGTKELIASGYSVDAILALGKALNNGKRPFSVDMFAKDNGIFCELVTTKKCPKWGYNLYGVSPNGWTYYRPIKCTFGAFIDAWARIAKYDVSATEAEAKKAEREKAKVAKKAAKAKADKETCLRAYGLMAEAWTIEQITKMAKAARAAKLAA